MEEKKKRITSTVILSVVLALFLFLCIAFLPFDVKAEIAKNSKAAQDSSSDPVEGVVATGAIAFVLGIGMVFFIFMYGFIILNSAICLIFTVKNRKSSLKAIRIISYIEDGAFLFCLISSLVKMILILI